MSPINLGCKKCSLEDSLVFTLHFIGPTTERFGQTKNKQQLITMLLPPNYFEVKAGASEQR